MLWGSTERGTPDAPPRLGLQKCFLEKRITPPAGLGCSFPGGQDGNPEVIRAGRSCHVVHWTAGTARCGDRVPGPVWRPDLGCGGRRQGEPSQAGAMVWETEVEGPGRSWKEDAEEGAAGLCNWLCWPV